jgi:WD40 repeat protein
LWDLLDQQFDRLSPLQQQIMYWLAINREGVTPAKLQEEISPKVPWRELLEALESLQARSLIFNERSLIETGNENLTQQPVIIEYVTERFIQTIEREITTGNLNLFRTYALIEAQTQDYGRDAQIQRILHSLTERLLTHFATQAQLEEHLCQILASLRHQTATQTGYAWSNLLNLFCHLKTLHGHQQAVRAIAFSPDGQQLASSSFDGTLKMWDVQTGECCQSLKGHNSVWSVTFSPNREWLLNASFDQTLKLWDVRTGQFYETLAGHSAPVCLAQCTTS